jgi:hypothetical protein
MPQIYAKKVLLPVIIFSLIAGCSLNLNTGVDGNGVAKTETRSLDEFNSIEARGNFIGDITAQKTQSFTISGDENILAVIETTVTDKKLVIKPKNGASINQKLELKLNIDLAELNKLTASGGGKFTIKDLKNDSFVVDESGSSSITTTGAAKNIDFNSSGASLLNADNLKISDPDKKSVIKISGGGTMSLGSVVNDSLDADLSGGSNLTLKGKLKNLKFSNSGSSKLQAMNLSATKADINLSGASSATLGISDTLTVDASGGSQLEYYGNPQLNQKVSGGSTVTRK